MRIFTLFLLLIVTPVFSRAELSPEVLRRAKSRIESLLGNRHGTPRTPVEPANPFILPQAAPVEGPAPTEDAPLSKTDALARFAATLNVSGYIQIKGTPHLIINRQPYRENDLIPVRETNGSVSFLLLKKITEAEFTLELDGVELVQKHTVK